MKLFLPTSHSQICFKKRKKGRKEGRREGGREGRKEGKKEGKKEEKKVTLNQKTNKLPQTNTKIVKLLYLLQ